MIFLTKLGYFGLMILLKLILTVILEFQSTVQSISRTSITIHCYLQSVNLSIYSIANQLVRLVGSTSNLRPVLEALYHRMLLYPPISHRVEPLRSARELLQNPKRLCQLVLMKRTDHHERHSDDMAIIRL